MKRLLQTVALVVAVGVGFLVASPVQATGGSNDPTQTYSKVHADCETWVSEWKTKVSNGQDNGHLVDDCVDTGSSVEAQWSYPGWTTGYYWEYTYYGSSGDAPPAQCSAGTFSPTWPKSSSGLACHGGCESITSIGGGPGGSSGSKTTGKTCSIGSDEGDTQPVVPSPQQAESCTPTGSCKYCDTNGNCVTAQRPDNKPPAIASAQGGAPAAAGPTDPASGAPTSTGGSGSGTGSSGTGDGNSGGVNGTVAGGNGDFSKNPASSSSSGCTAGDACNAGQASGDIGTLYKPGSNTVGSAFSDFKSNVSGSAFIGSATAFFTVNATGSCPAWHIPGNKFWGASGFDFSFFCDPGMALIFAAVGWIVLAVGAFCAFRIALY